MSDLGTHDEVSNLEFEDTVETISDQSGDTLLLTYDETSESVNWYVDILKCRRVPLEIQPGLNVENYLGRGRLVTDFERANFTYDDITPGRPCTAYFSAGYFVDSKTVFDKLQELEISRESIVCIQRRP